LLLGALVVVAITLAPTTEVTAGQIKVDVCHVTNVPTEGDGHVISIADPAWESHEAHGDKKIDPNDPSVTVDEDGTTCHVSQCVFEARDDEVTTPMDTPITIDVLFNDILCGSSVTLSLQVGPSHGLVSPWVGGTITYSPEAGFFGTDSFTYGITGAEGQYDEATVTINVGL
jgi:hypothetical protein